MPNRILKESICTSENIDQLSSFVETVFYRLIVNCDDFGRMDARPKLLASKLFPLKDIRSKQIEDALRELTSAELVTTYEVDGKPFLQMNTWDRHQNIRAKQSRYPSPEQACRHLYANDINCKQMNSDNSKCSRNPIQSNQNPNPNPNPIQSDARALEDDPDIGETFGYNQFLLEAVQNWLAYKKERREAYKPSGLNSLLKQIQKNIAEYGEDAVINVMQESMAANYQGITWDKLKRQSRSTGKKPLTFADMLHKEMENDKNGNFESFDPFAG